MHNVNYTNKGPICYIIIINFAIHMYILDVPTEKQNYYKYFLRIRRRVPISVKNIIDFNISHNDFTLIYLYNY